MLVTIFFYVFFINFYTIIRHVFYNVPDSLLLPF